uniref:SJCHGC02595 protein n=1 Tax=Schistosoma japonicum TaxID=6182 RepID=Q5DFW5_SCHJA|nr:SJCHGC02595 protein [Schistosoma japonicum]CAX75740.1 hypothetical protein [Schistosoma japonicum]
MFSNIFFFIFFHSMVMYCNGVEDEEEYLPQEVKQAIEKYSYAVFKFLNSLYILLSQETLLNPSSGQMLVSKECKRLESLRSSKTAKDYLTEQNLADKSLLDAFKKRFERASTMDKTTMLAINEYNLLIKRSEEKWTARKDLNKVEKKYFAQTRQNANKNQHVLEQKSKLAYHIVSSQIWTIKLKLLKEVKTINRYRESKNNKEFLKEEEESRKILKHEFNTLADMIEEAEYQRFKFYKTLTYEDRIYRLVLTMDSEREICRILD